jgi:hypothetical protein
VFKTEASLRKEIVAEMRNEAKILGYLRRMGYENAPRLLYSGYWGGVCYINVTELIQGNYENKLKKRLPSQIF